MMNAEYGVNSYSLNGSRARLSETDPALASMYRLSQSMAVLDARGTMGSSFLPSLERKHINGVRLDIRTSVDNRVITIWLIRFAIDPTAIRLVDKECHFPDSIFMSQKVLCKARALWPFVGGYVSQASGTMSARNVLLVGDPNSIILEFQDEDLGKDVPYKDEINIYANDKFVGLDTGSTAYGAVHVYDTFAPLVGSAQVSTVGSAVAIGFKERGLSRDYKFKIQKSTISKLGIVDDVGSAICNIAPGRFWEGTKVEAFDSSVENMVGGAVIGNATEINCWCR